MKRKIILTALAAALALPTLSHAQARYWSVFTSGAGSKKFDLSTTPASISAISPQSGASTKRNYENSAFDLNGNLVFSVYDGRLYNSSGSLVTSLEAANSEIEIINIPCQKLKYLIIYWRFNNDPGGTNYDLIVREVDASGPAISVGSVSELLHNVTTTYNAGIVAGKANGDGSRYVYSIERNVSSTSGYIKRWTFYPDGTHSSATTLTSSAPVLCGSNNIVELTPDGDNIYYVGDGTFSNRLYIYNISGNSFSYRQVPTKSGAGQAVIKGLEYAPSTGNYYVSYVMIHTATATNVGGIGYWDESSSATFVDNTSTDINYFAYGDLEYGKNGLMYLCATDGDPNNTPGSTVKSKIASIDPTVNGAPAYLTSGASFIYNGGSYNGGSCFYICNQIDGENYSQWWPKPAIKVYGDYPASDAILDVFTCGSGVIDIVAEPLPGHELAISVYEIDGSGDRGELQFTETLLEYPGTVNLLELNGGFLASNPGDYSVDVFYTDPCLTVVAAESPLKVNVLTTTPENAGTFTWIGGSDVSDNCASPEPITTPEEFGINGGESDGVIDWFYLTIEAADASCSSFTNISDGSNNKTYVYGDKSRIVADLPTYLSEHAPTGSGSPYGAAYFSAAGEQKYRVTLVTGNLCDVESSVSGMFEVVSTARYTNGTVNNTQLTVYPNPANSAITITWNDINQNKTSAHATVYGITGQLAAQWTVAQGANQFDISGLAPGMYLVKVEGENGLITRHFIKQ